MAFKDSLINWLSLGLLAIARGFFGLRFREIPNDPTEIAQLLPEDETKDSHLYHWEPNLAREEDPTTFSLTGRKPENHNSSGA